MQRICVIGDSTTAALKAAWGEIGAEMPDVSLTVFAAPGKMIGGLVVENGCALVPGSEDLRRRMVLRSDGIGRIDIAGFDAYITCGMELDAAYISRVRTELRSRKATEEAILEAACARVGETIHGQIVQKLRACTQSPLVMIPRPFRVISPEKPFWNRVRETNSGPVFTDLFNRACERYAAQTRCRFLPQPQETVGETGIDTAPAFARDGVRFFAEADDDLAHMNAVFGTLVLRAALAALN
ncbi:MAG TPA: SGNH/GDSL hydrolase family protein [Rhizomicrobium sp.]|jgi:hypothetical protein